MAEKSRAEIGKQAAVDGFAKSGKPHKKRSHKYDKKLKLYGSFESIVKAIVSEPKPQYAKGK